MRCPGCQQQVPDDADFCPRCGVRVAVCPDCGTAAAPGDAFCRRCGRALAAMAPPARFASPRGYTPRHLAEKILTSRGALEGERKTVTVVFADLVGSTARAERLDPEDVRAILAPYHARLRHELERFGGTVEKFIGDAVVGVFGAPTAH